MYSVRPQVRPREPVVLLTIDRSRLSAGVVVEEVLSRRRRRRVSEPGHFGPVGL